MVTYHDIEKAHQRISDHIHNTPILTSDSLDNELGSNLFFKCENFQKTGSFKIRGATNSILQLNDTEIKNTLKAHIEDGVALTKFLYWFKFNQKVLTEKTIENKLESLRKKSKNYSIVRSNQ